MRLSPEDKSRALDLLRSIELSISKTERGKKAHPPIGDLILQIREIMGISCSGLAKALKLSPQGVSKWENNQNKPNPDSLTKLRELIKAGSEGEDWIISHSYLQALIDMESP